MSIIVCSSKTVFIFGLLMGVFLAISVVHLNTLDYLKYNNDLNFKKSHKLTKPFTSVVSMDELRYGDKQLRTESQFLYNTVNILCLVLVRKFTNAFAIKNTWGQYCNTIIFYGTNLKNDDKVINLTIKTLQAESSWHLLCKVLYQLPSKAFHWAFFINDDTFAITENLRLFLLSKPFNETLYFGHAIQFWGVRYNVAEAGYVLSRGSVLKLTEKFNSSEKCKKGGRFWKQEDFYLGKHLDSLNIRPSDTRDELGLSIFHGYNLYQLLFPGSLPKLANYYKYSVYPTKCCSKYSITFQAIEGDRMHTYHYLIYHMQLFSAGDRGNKPAPTPMPEDEVWKSFLRMQGVEDLNVSAEVYFELWKNKVAEPDAFNEELRKAHYISQPPSAGGFVNMPEVLDSIISNYANMSGKQ